MFALVAMYLMRSKFGTAEQLVETLQGWMRTLPLGSNAKEGSTSSKLDEVADWNLGLHIVYVFA
jgi:hypothetical protein